MKKLMLLFLLLIVSLLLNPYIGYWGWGSLFLILPYAIYMVNLVVLKKTALAANMIGNLANQQLVLINSHVYQLLLKITTVATGLILSVLYVYLTLISKVNYYSSTTENESVIKLIISIVLISLIINLELRNINNRKDNCNGTTRRIK